MRRAREVVDASLARASAAASRARERVDEAGERAARGTRAAAERALGKRATEFLWNVSALNPMVVKRAIEQRAVSAVATHWRAVEGAGAAASGTALWRAARAFKEDVMGVPCDSVVFDAAFGDASLLGGSLLLAGAGAFALRQRWRLDVDHAVTMAMRKLESHSGVREILGGPVTAGAARVVVTSGGGLAIFKRTTSRFFGAVTLPVSVDSKWAHVAFELRGTRQSGVVSLGARKWAGAYAIPLLTLEVQTRGGEKYRLFLEGGVKEYEASVLPSLRAPLEASARDEKFKRAKEESDAQDAEKAAALAAERRAASAPKPLDEGGGMYAHERALDVVARATHFVRTSIQRASSSKVVSKN